MSDSFDATLRTTTYRVDVHCSDPSQARLALVEVDMFKIGDRVLWIRQTSPPHASIGTIVDVIPNDDNLPDFTICDVEFSFGCLTLHGSELKVIQTTVSSCQEKNRLWSVYQKSLDVYLQGIVELKAAMEMMAHTEFEFLRRKIVGARGVAQAARQRYEEHTATHRC